MRNKDRWAPTKYVHRDGRLRASRQATHLAVGSRLVADLVAERYDASLRTHAHGRLVDLGCGRVPLYGAYAGHVDAVVTVDLRGAADEGAHVDIEHDLNRPLPFADASFDTVILSDALEHLQVPQQLCAELARILTERGCVIGNTPFMYPIHEAPHDYFRFTEHGLRYLMSASGLKMQVLEPLGGSVEVGCDLIAKHLAALGAPGRLSATLLQTLVAWFGQTGLGARVRRATSHRYCCGYFFIALRS